MPIVPERLVELVACLASARASARASACALNIDLTLLSRSQVGQRVEDRMRSGDRCDTNNHVGAQVRVWRQL